MIIKNLEHFQEIMRKYQENFGFAMVSIDGELRSTFDVYRTLRDYMSVHKITDIHLPKGLDWDEDVTPKHKYVIEFSAFKPSGKYYTSMKHHVLETNSNKWVDDFSKLNEIKEKLLINLDTSCGLRPGSIQENSFIVMCEILDLKDINNQSCFKSIIKT